MLWFCEVYEFSHRAGRGSAVLFVISSNERRGNGAIDGLVKTGKTTFFDKDFKETLIIAGWPCRLRSVKPRRKLCLRRPSRRVRERRPSQRWECLLVKQALGSIRPDCCAVKITQMWIQLLLRNRSESLLPFAESWLIPSGQCNPPRRKENRPRERQMVIFQSDISELVSRSCVGTFTFGFI